MTITLRAVKGSELTHAEVDGNFTEISAAVNFLLPQSVAFSAAIPFTGNLFMTQQTVASAIAFTVDASPQIGAHTYVRLVANGTNVPTFTGMKEWGGSAGYDNRAGITNEIEFFYDGNDYWYFINQAVGAVATDTVAPTASSSAVANATPTVINIAMSEALDAAYVPASSAFTVSGHTVSSAAISGSTINVTVSAAFVNGEAARTVSYTQPGSNQVRDSAGNLLASFSSLAITNNVDPAATAPAQVTGLTLGTATTTTQSLTWNTPSNGGSVITDYVIQWAIASSGTWNTFVDGTSTTAATTVTGLTASTSYDYRVAAVNAIGTGTTSATSTGSTAAAATAPGAPTIGTATAGNTTASVTFSAPGSSGGSAITGYTVTSSPGGITGSGAASPIAVSGLTNGTAYTFTVTATNSIGTGPASAASNSVTPVASYVRLTALNALTESGSGPYAYIGAGGTFGGESPGGVANKTLQSAIDGSLSMTFTGFVVATGAEFVFAVQSSSSTLNYASQPYSIYISRNGAGLYQPKAGGSNVTETNTVIPADGDIVRMRRSGTSLIGEVSKNSGSTWTTIYTWTGVSTGVLYFQIANGSAVGTISGLTASGLTP